LSASARRVSLGRIVVVTVGLSLTGAVCGAVLGGLAFLVGLAADKGVGALRDWAIAFALGAYGGAILGAVLAPLLAWIFLRRVSDATTTSLDARASMTDTADYRGGVR
jgi:hypothetical protein